MVTKGYAPPNPPLPIGSASHQKLHGFGYQAARPGRAASEVSTNRPPL